MSMTNEQAAIMAAAQLDPAVFTHSTTSYAEVFYQWMESKRRLVEREAKPEDHPETAATGDIPEAWRARANYMMDNPHVSQEVRDVFLSAVRTGNYTAALGLWSRARSSDKR
jgi:hypothetical protein